MGGWSGKGRLVNDPTAGSVAQFRSTNAADVVTSITRLPRQDLAGCVLHCAARVKAEGVSAKPQEWNGIKFMLIIEAGGEKSYPQASLEVGSFDWREAVFTAKVPPHATNILIVLGLERVNGEVRFDEVLITVSKPAPGPILARTGPKHIGHDLPRLRGAMVSPRIDEEGLRVLGQEWKANLIRWQLIRHHTPGQTAPMENYDAWLEGELKRLDALLPACEKYGLRVVLDLHSPPGGKGTSSGYVGSDDRLFSDPACQEKLVEVWRHMARRYKQKDIIWGYDLVNEPVEDYVAPGCNDWQELAERTARAIREIDPVRTIIVEPAEWGGASGLRALAPLTVSNVVYSFHMYVPHQFTHQQLRGPDEPISYPGRVAGQDWDKAALERAMQPAIDFQKRHNVHIYVGEFSAIRWAPGDSAARYLEDLTGLFEKHGWDWSYHAWREFHGWSVEHDGNRNNTARTQELTDRAKALRAWFSKNRK